MAVQLILLLLFLLIAAATTGAESVSFLGSWQKSDTIFQNRVMLQGFNWESAKGQKPWYDVLLDLVEEISEAGITDVWLPPPTDSLSPEGYLPRRLYDLRSKYGDEAKLKLVIQAFHEHGVKCIADIVINHRCAERQDNHGYWCMFEGGTEDSRLDWGPWNIVAEDETCRDSSGQPDTGWNYEHAPDIDHTNITVQQGLIDWMRWLRHDIGFDGWRFDFAKGYAGRFIGTYVKETGPLFSVGEIWNNMNYDEYGNLKYDQNSHRQDIVNWIDSTGARSAAFDFTTKGILQEAVKGQLWRLRDSNSRPAGVLGYWREMAVTFIDNHDTGSTQAMWPFPSDKVMQGYAYILTHPGIPCIFWDHFFDWGIKEEIKKLIKIRQMNRINPSSMWNIMAAENDMYVARTDDQIQMKIGSRYDIGQLKPSSEFQIATSGKDYCVWERKSPGTPLSY